MEEVIDTELPKPPMGETFKVVKSFWGKFKPRAFVNIINYDSMKFHRPNQNKETATYVEMFTQKGESAYDDTHFQTGGRQAFYDSVCCKKHFEL